MRSKTQCIGCGKLGEDFISLNSNKKNLRFVDNDTKKHGLPFGDENMVSYDDMLS